MDGAQDIQQIIQFIDFDRVPFALLVLAIGWGMLQLSTRVLDDLGERFAGRRLTFKKAKALARFVSYIFIAVVVASSVLRLESETLLAVAGAISVAVGFAFKDLLGSLIAGVILLIDEPFQVGDRISFGGHYGEVKEIGLRSVRLDTLDGCLVTIPNNTFLTQSVSNNNAGVLDSMCVLPFYVASGEDFKLAQRIVAEAAITSRYVYLKKPVITHVRDEFVSNRHFATVVKVVAYVFDVRHELVFADDITERVKTAFREHGIRTPDQPLRAPNAPPKVTG